MRNYLEDLKTLSSTAQEDEEEEDELKNLSPSKLNKARLFKRWICGGIK